MYLVFTGECYYAKGGMNDFKGVFDDLPTAASYCAERLRERGQHADEWFQIVDRSTMQIVEQSDVQAHRND